MHRYERAMNITLVNPGWKRGSLWAVNVFKVPPFGLAQIASLTPPEHNVTILDENIERIDTEKLDTDVAAITAMTPLASRAYEISSSLRKRGILTIMGGIHPSLMPSEALKFCDSVVIGEAEGVWRSIISDIERGALKTRYLGQPHSLEALPKPRLDLCKREKYFETNLVQTTRGCPNNCDFCSVSTFFGGKFRSRPVSDVISEIAELKGKRVLFVDDNIAGNPEHSKRLFKELIPLGKKWYSQSSLAIVDDELLKLASESGCITLFIGFESISESCLREVHKVNLVSKYKEYIRKIRDYGITIEGFFIFGFDGDDKTTFKKTVDFCHEMELEAVQFTILTPFPKTKLFNRLEVQGRILTRDWSKYDATHVVFSPKQMTVEEIYEGFTYAYDEYYSIKSVLSRIFKSRHIEVAMANLGFRQFKKAIKKDFIIERLAS